MMYWMKSIRSLISWQVYQEYSSAVEHVKIDRRTGSTLISMDEIKITEKCPNQRGEQSKAPC